jgi:ABC-2 type transport system permease protein
MSMEPETLRDDAPTTEQLFGSTPSREETATPAWVRLAGLVGTVCFAAGIVMYIYNVAVDLRNPPANRLPTDPAPWKFGFVTLFQLVGLGGLLIQAGREREAQPRRMLGLLGVVFFALGTLFLANMLVSEGVKNWLLAGGSMSADVAASRGKWAGLAATIVTAVVWLLAWVLPFVRSTTDRSTSLWSLLRLWVTHLGEARISAMTLYGALGLAVLAVIAYLLKDKLIAYSETVLMYSADNKVPYGLGSFAVGFLMLGLPFLLIFGKTEDDPAWARVPSSLLVTVGTLAAFFGLVGVFTDLIGVPDYTFPYGVTLAILGLLFLGLFISQHRGTSDTSYHVARWMGLVGLAVVVLALIRSLLPWIVEQTWLHDLFPALEDMNLPSYLVPNGFIFLVLGGAYFLIGRMLSSQSALMVMTRKELASFLTSPIGYIILGGVIVLSWIVFLVWISEISGFGRRGGIPEPVVGSYFFDWFIALFFMIAIPLLTMRLISEEHRSGTMEVLLTAPVSEPAIVISKFLGAWIFVVLVFLVWLTFPTLLRIAGQESFDFRPMLSATLGWCLIAFGFVGVGVFFSALSRNQLVPMLFTFAVILVFFMLFMIERILMNEGKVDPSGPTMEFLRHMSFINHMRYFSTGQVPFKYVLFHLTFGLFWIFLTIRVLESRKWR